MIGGDVPVSYPFDRPEFIASYSGKELYDICLKIKKSDILKKLGLPKEFHNTIPVSYTHLSNSNDYEILWTSTYHNDNENDTDFFNELKGKHLLELLKGLINQENKWDSDH